MITGAKFVGMYVRDQDTALRFWTETVGWTCTTDVGMGPPDSGADRWIEVVPPGGQGTYLVLFTPEDSLDRVGSFGPVWFDCDDLDATHAELVGKGVMFPVEPQVAPWDPSVRWAQFADDEGNTFGLSQADPMNGSNDR